MAAATERGLTENPFRLTGLGPFCSYAELRRAAESRSTSYKVGLASSVEFAEELGIDRLADVVSLVRQMKSDPGLWFQYALFYAPIKPANRLSGSPLAGTSFSPRPDSRVLLPGHEQRNKSDVGKRFLDLWVAFIKEPSSWSLSRCLAEWHWITSESAWAEELREHVCKELGLDHDAAREVYTRVASEETASILGKAVGASLDQWRRGETATATAMVRTLLESPIDDDLEQRTIKPFVSLGDQLSEAIQREEVRLSYDDVWLKIMVPPEADQLMHLIEAMDRHHPRVAHWRKSFGGFVNFHLEEIFGEALDRAKQGDHGAAQRRLEGIRDFKYTPADTRQVASERIATVGGMMETERRAKLVQSDLAREQKERNNVRASSSGGTVPVWVRWVIWIAIIGAVRACKMSTGGTSSSASAETAPAVVSGLDTPPPAQSQPEPVQSSQSASDIDDPKEFEAAQRRVRLLEEMQTLEQRMVAVSEELEAESAKLSAAKAALESRFDSLEANPPDRYSDSEVAAYNRRVRAYEKDRRAFNGRVGRYNSKVKEQEKRRKRIEEIGKALG